ncbi:uncharacterized protein Bfra_006769 [Botrytis fragariae]|uniref:Uncharacterized protein n=1 Tax=Botrytis fragariae TaxID=1964551 RepID=A0A8H6B5Q6_9HELO|nr:uncharacterized protein Bfra_006769 [Botrytis fragariae]KAF5879560.1 hypothetical protein Bfra_006769 [Botrytis fragariae]
MVILSIWWKWKIFVLSRLPEDDVGDVVLRKDGSYSELSGVERFRTGLYGGATEEIDGGGVN